MREDDSDCWVVNIHSGVLVGGGKLEKQRGQLVGSVIRGEMTLAQIRVVYTGAHKWILFEGREHRFSNGLNIGGRGRNESRMTPGFWHNGRSTELTSL